MRRLALVFVILLAGCLESPARGPPQGDLLDVVEAHVGAYLARDVEAVLRFEADPWVDLGGGSCPSHSDPPAGSTAARVTAPTAPTRNDDCDSANVTHEERRASLAAFFDRADYREATEGKRARDLLDFEAARVEEADAMEPWSSSAFVPQPGDKAVHVPPREGSYFFDGWFRIYRSVDGGWLSVAGD